MKTNGPNTNDEQTLGPTSRRDFCKLAIGSTVLMSGLGAYEYILKPTRKEIPGKIMGASSKVGHLLRDGSLAPPETTVTIETVIVGGGIAGMSAAWWLKRKGYEKFLLLELENKVGGNAQSGRNESSAFPWGAHYLPLPGEESTYVRELLEELGIIRGYDAQKLPIYDEFHLCSDPHERLYHEGRWHEGLTPQIGLKAKDHKQFKEFFEFIEQQKLVRGSDGKRAFVVPVDLSSQDANFQALDKISMAEFMKERNWDSPYLVWYLNYCCRDDYGATYDKVSAWAGIHYFASRVGKGANAEAQTVLTWPEGNGWLVHKLYEKNAQHIQSNALVFAIAQHGEHVFVDYLDVIHQKTLRIQAKNVIFAGPRFVGSRIIDSLKANRPSYLERLNYAPWMVANVTVNSSAIQGHGAAPCLENVSYYSKSLGYVIATHQSLARVHKKTVITYYLALSETDSLTARREAAKKSHRDWVQEIAQDLNTMHPGIRDAIDNIDVWIWGHGMIVPEPGFVSGKDRQEMLKSIGNIHFAHSDMSGVSIFEEAQYHGVKAAIKVLAAVAPPQMSLL